MTKYFFASIVLFCILTGCAHEVTVRKFPSKAIIPPTNKYDIDLPGSHKPIRMLYLGCGHLAIEYGEDLIVTDPYFSIQSFKPGGKIKSNEMDFVKYKAMVAESGLDLKQTKSVWIAHAHYDHLMDLPLLMEGMLPGEVAIHGNLYGRDILSHFISASQYQPITMDDAFNPSNPGKPKWREAAPTIRVLPITSDHAPHMKVGPIPIHLMKGKLKPEHFAEKFTKTDSWTKKNQWREGDVYAFLVDFLEGDSVVYRFYIQTSASHFPLGRPPLDLIAERPVDVAVLCLASSNTVKPYPVEILKALQPKQTVFIHWEDFFERKDFNQYRLVRMTNFKKIDKRMSKAGMPLTTDKFVMPQPGTLLTFK